jgi:hypothetical protein
MADDKGRARRVLGALLPNRELDQQDTVYSRFEHTPEGAAEWLGESGQPTQADVFFEVRRADRPIGFVVVEVKFTEAGFGACRGWNGKKRKVWTNPNREHCLDAVALIAAPQTNCRLSKVEKRRY